MIETYTAVKPWIFLLCENFLHVGVYSSMLNKYTINWFFRFDVFREQKWLEPVTVYSTDYPTP